MWGSVLRFADHREVGGNNNRAKAQNSTLRESEADRIPQAFRVQVGNKIPLPVFLRRVAGGKLLRR